MQIEKLQSKCSLKIFFLGKGQRGAEKAGWQQRHWLQLDVKEDSTEQIFEFYISTTFLSNKYLFKYLSQPIRIITMILCCNNISLIFLQRIYVVHNISPTNTCCTCNSAIYIVTITTPSFSYTRLPLGCMPFTTPA